ncbi:MAG: HEPN domain-containing protein [bacterium]|nr:HEPN domain-containing protein [bacterium]
MAYDKAALIRYRIERAKETFKEVEMALEHEHFNLAENRIYYGMFYMVQALALRFDFSTVRHTQLLGWFNKSFVRTKKVDVALGKAYQAAFDKRQEGDYQDFVTFEKEEVEHDLSLMREFLDAVEALID